MLSEHRLCFRPRLPYQDRNAGLENPRFFKCDFRQCIAQEVTMIQADTCDDTELGCDDVGTVQPSSQPDLNNCHIYVHISEPLESQPRSNLEKGQFELVERV